MTRYKPVTAQSIFMGKLAYGSDLLDALNDVCVAQNISLGKIEAIGAVQHARIGFYDQSSRTYGFFSIDTPLEITNLTGNISVKDDKPFVHAHVTLSDEKGHAYGGHLAPGTSVFACEFILTVFDGTRFSRYPDDQTGLPLWAMEP